MLGEQKAATNETRLSRFIDLDSMVPSADGLGKVVEHEGMLYLAAYWRDQGCHQTEAEQDLPFLYSGYYRPTPWLTAWIRERMLNLPVSLEMLFIQYSDGELRIRLFAKYSQIIGSRLLSDDLVVDRQAAEWFGRKVTGRQYEGVIGMVKIKDAAPKVTGQKQVADDVRDVLRNLDWEDGCCRIVGQLDRKLYVKVNDVLEACGGKWDKKTKRHVFDVDGEDSVRSVIDSGVYLPPADERQLYQDFPTSIELSAEVVDVAGIDEESEVLEPSAGEGRIAKAARAAGARRVKCYELHVGRAQSLSEAGFDAESVDFMTVQPDPSYTHVVMNPPFTRGQDIDHVMHAFRFLRVGGTLTAIVSAGIMFRTDKKTVAFRRFIDDNGRVVRELPAGEFKESKTMVKTVLITLRRHA